MIELSHFINGNYLKRASPKATLRQATKSSAATLFRDDNKLKMCLLCTCESSVNEKKVAKMLYFRNFM